MVSSWSLQRGHCEGPMMPLLNRLSQVRIRLCKTRQIKVVNLGQFFRPQILIQEVSDGSLGLVRIWCASLVVNMPFGL